MEMPRDDSPEQRLADPTLSLGDYAAECREELRRCIEDAFLDIGSAAWRSKEINIDEMTQKALDGRQRYFQSLKGGTNLSEERVSEGILWEVDRQQKLHRLMRELSERFESMGVRFEVVDTGYYPDNTLWDFRLEPGCTIAVDEVPQLIAFPPANAKTCDYLVPRSGPIAWQVLNINPDAVILAPWHEPLSENFSKAAAGVWSGAEVIGISSNLNIHLALSYREYLYLSLISDIDLGELDCILEKTGFGWVVAGNPFNFEGVIYNGKPDEVPHLFKEIMPGPLF